MNADTMVEWKRRTPFEPFAILCSDGTVYEVRRPDLVMPLPREAIVGVADSRGDAETAQFVAYDRITQIERIGQPAGGVPVNFRGIRELQTRQPFIPFKLELTTGEIIDVKHPEMISPTRNLVGVIGPYRNGIPEGLRAVSYFHIVQVHLPADATLPSPPPRRPRDDNDDEYGES